jgi:hypothetical protein
MHTSGNQIRDMGFRTMQQFRNRRDGQEAKVFNCRISRRMADDAAWMGGAGRPTAAALFARD